MRTPCIGVSQDAPSPHLCQGTQDLTPMIEELSRVDYQLYFKFQQEMIAMLARAMRYEISAITVLADASTLLGQLTQGLQEQNRRIVARMATECDSLTEILNQQRSQGEAPIDQGTTKRPMGTMDEGALNKRKNVQSMRNVPVPIGQLSMVTMTSTPPSKICQRCYRCSSRAHMMRGYTIPEKSILCHCYGIARHRTQDY
ncbi:hypothetical protein NE237_032194 [Protea cynaroides]|uniref:Uncharacterized protein n=1 Tax=Protea cynaroides TaxID=273540 RepID=A0A9Q0R383_9MAGN|nr:hypothetical protein NE237_032194 [Protea cynaroides]